MVVPRGDRKTTLGHPGILAVSYKREEDWWEYGHAVIPGPEGSGRTRWVVGMLGYRWANDHMWQTGMLGRRWGTPRWVDKRVRWTWRRLE